MVDQANSSATRSSAATRLPLTSTAGGTERGHVLRCGRRVGDMLDVAVARFVHGDDDDAQRRRQLGDAAMGYRRVIPEFGHRAEDRDPTRSVELGGARSCAAIDVGLAL